MITDAAGFDPAWSQVLADLAGGSAGWKRASSAGPRRRNIARRAPSLESYVQDFIALAAAWRVHLNGIAGFLADKGARRR